MRWSYGPKCGCFTREKHIKDEKEKDEEEEGSVFLLFSKGKEKKCGCANVPWYTRKR
jgi:hypothetical protein